MRKSLKAKRHSTNKYATLMHVSGSNSSRSNVVRSATTYRPQRPPVWIPMHLAYNCAECEQEFGGTLSRRQAEHCRNCGRCFCEQCCNHFVAIPEFGYFEPTRVCYGCRQRIERRAEETKVQDERLWN